MRRRSANKSGAPTQQQPAFDAEDSVDVDHDPDVDPGRGAVALGDGHVTVEAADVTEAHRVARVRRDFVANVSHELKTPVGALQLLAEALLDALAADEDAELDPEAARRFAERIQHESTRMGRLVIEL